MTRTQEPNCVHTPVGEQRNVLEGTAADRNATTPTTSTTTSTTTTTTTTLAAGEQSVLRQEIWAKAKHLSDFDEGQIVMATGRPCQSISIRQVRWGVSPPPSQLLVPKVVQRGTTGDGFIGRPRPACGAA